MFCNLIVFTCPIIMEVMERDHVCATLSANGEIEFKVIIDGEAFGFDKYIKAHIDGYNKDMLYVPGVTKKPLIEGKQFLWVRKFPTHYRCDMGTIKKWIVYEDKGYVGYVNVSVDLRNNYDEAHFRKYPIYYGS